MREKKACATANQEHNNESHDGITPVTSTTHVTPFCFRTASWGSRNGFCGVAILWQPPRRRGQSSIPARLDEPQGQIVEEAARVVGHGEDSRQARYDPPLVHPTFTLKCVRVVRWQRTISTRKGLCVAIVADMVYGALSALG